MEPKADLLVFYGGRFSPPTFAHKGIVLEAYNKLHNTYPTKNIHIAFVPTNKYYGAKGVEENCESENNRYALTKLLVDDLNNLQLPGAIFSMNDNEIKYGKKHKKFIPTFLSILDIMKKYNIEASNTYIILPQYQFEQLLNGIWKQHISILENYNFIVLPKIEGIIYKTNLEEQLINSFIKEARLNNINANPNGISLRDRIMLIDVESRQISGTSARQLIYSGAPNLEAITIPTIASYIKAKKLYRKRACLTRAQRKGLNRRHTRKIGNANN